MKSLVECLLEEGLVKFDNKEIVSKEEAFKGVKFDSGVFYMLKGKKGQLEINKSTDNHDKLCFYWYCAVGGNDDSGFLCYLDEVKSIDKSVVVSIVNTPSLAKAKDFDKIEIYH